jgi:hypothetical protein
VNDGLDRYTRRPPSASSASIVGYVAKAVNRRKQNQQVRELQEIGRETATAVAREKQIVVEKVARLQARRRAYSELKFELLRADAETRIIGGENDELRVKCQLLDDDFFQLTRHDVLNWE